ncbi:MAG TPA: outer membrane protein transport protein [Longimicrobium sp.]|nr:outer membrane protein transport protein [Longimicrobium sp.]
MRRSLALAAACCLAAAPAAAQGSGVDQQSACMTGRVGTGVAAPCDDASAVYFSPAGLALHGGVASFGASLIRSGNTFRYDQPAPGQVDVVERDDAWKTVPQGYASLRVGRRLAVGVGYFVPYGLGIEWPVCPAELPPGPCTDPNFEGRFTGYDNSLRGEYIQPTVAYQVAPGLALGVGVDFVLGGIEVHQRQFGPAASGLGRTEVVDVGLRGTGSGMTFNASAILRLNPRTTVGVRYLHSAEVEIDGDAVFAQVPTGVASVDAQVQTRIPADQGVSTTLEFPAQIVAGVSHRHGRVHLLADVQRTKWSSFDALPVDFAGNAPDQTLELNYRDTDTFRFAAELAALEALTLRAGFRYNEAATPRATPFLPEGERNYYTAGLGYRLPRGVSADLALQYVHQPDRAGSVLPEGTRAGIYESRGLVLGLTLAWRFGGHAGAAHD